MFEVRLTAVGTREFGNEMIKALAPLLGWPCSTTFKSSGDYVVEFASNCGFVCFSAVSEGALVSYVLESALMTEADSDALRDVITKFAK